MARRVFNGSDLINTVQGEAVQQNTAPVQAERPVESMPRQMAAPVRESAVEPAPAAPAASRRGARRAAVEGAGAAPFRAAAAIPQQSVKTPAVADRVIQPQQPVQRVAAVSRVEPTVPDQEEKNPYAHMFASWDLLPPMMVIRRVKRK